MFKINKSDIKPIASNKHVNTLYPQFINALKQLEIIEFPFDEITIENVNKLRKNLKVKSRKIKDDDKDLF